MSYGEALIVSVLCVIAIFCFTLSAICYGEEQTRRRKRRLDRSLHAERVVSDVVEDQFRDLEAKTFNARIGVSRGVGRYDAQERLTSIYAAISKARATPPEQPLPSQPERGKDG